MIRKEDETTKGLTKTNIEPQPTGDINSEGIPIPGKQRKDNFTPHGIFDKTIKRANNLIAFSDYSKISQGSKDDALRAAVVLCISALDAYIRTCSIEHIVKKLCDEKKPLSKDLKAYICQLITHEEFVDIARSYNFQEKITTVIKNDFTTKTAQGTYKITHFMSLAGYKDIFETVSQKADKNQQKLKSDIHKYTQRRHDIAHCGDFDLSQTPPIENAIDKDYAQNCVDFVCEFVKHINTLKTDEGEK